MNVLITGGTGFAGAHLARRLLQQNYRVVVLDVQRGLFFDDLTHLGADIRLGSVTDRAVVDDAMDGAEVVYHLAAAFRKVNLSKRAYWETNVEGTRHVLEAALRHGVRKVVYCSTCGVHGDVAQTPSDETAPIAPEDYYQYTKYEAEKCVGHFVTRGGVALILRPAAIYGPGDPGRFLKLFRHARRGRFMMFGTGLVHYHPLHVENLVDAFQLAAASERGGGEAYLIADEQYYTLDDLVTAVGEALGIAVAIERYPFWPLWIAALGCELVCKPFAIEPPLFRRRVDWFRQNRAFAIGKAKLELGYQPKITLPEGLVQTVDWYRTHGYL